MEESTLSGIFMSGFLEFQAVMNGNAVDGVELTKEHRTERLFALIAKFLAIARHIDKLALFSTNEEIDDIRTDDLKYLLVDFALAELHYEVPVMENRLERVKNAIAFWEQHMNQLHNVKGGDPADFKVWMREEASSIPDSRTEKIERAKRRSKLDNQIKLFFDMAIKAKGGQSVMEECDEETSRDLALALLQRSAIDSIEHLSMAKQEIPLLEMRELRMAGGNVSPDTEPKASKPFMISIKNQDDLRELYRSRIFRPPHELPSVSLDELAEYEMALLRDRERETKTREDRLNRIKLSKKEDQLEEEEQVKTREWDDWKDENPKGWGNRNKNVG